MLIATDLLVERHGPVTTLIINRPEAMNALHPKMHFAMQEVLDNFSADIEQRICVIRGAGERAFCAGSDLMAITARRAEGYKGPPAYPPGGYGGITERFDLEKPVIAAVNGIAMGGGFEIALACDLIIASSNAKFALPEPRVGGFALAGGVHRLARQIGLKPAMDLILTGRAVTGEEGLRFGFVNQVAAPENFEAELASWIDALLLAAPTSLAVAKQSLMRGMEEPSLALAIARQKDYPAYRAWLDADEIAEGSKAFAEKRKPSWVYYEQ